MEITMFNMIAILAVLIAGGLFFYELVISRNKKKKQGKIVRVFVYEKIGKEIVFDHQTTAEEKQDEELGLYFVTSKNKIPIDRLSNDDFFLDKVYGKGIALIKYSDDDYRPLVRLRSEEFFKWKTIQRQARDENDKPVFDEEGEPVIEEVKVPDYYEEPLGISQGDREAFRFKLKYDKRMLEKYAEKKGFWDKYGVPVMTVTLALILMMSFMYMTNQNGKTQIAIAETFGEQAEKIVKSQENPSWVESLVNKVNQRQAEQGAPPK